MGAKKKVQLHNQKQVKPMVVASNKLRNVKTNDGANFQVNDALISKYSGKLRRKIEQFKGDEVLEIQDADKITFKYIEEFLSNRKDKEVGQIHFPIRSNISLKYIMQQSDANLMQKVQNQGGMQLVGRLLQVATNLQMQDLRKRLFCLVALELSNHTIDQLKQVYDIPNVESNEDSLKGEMKSHLETLKKNYDKKIEEE